MRNLAIPIILCFFLLAAGSTTRPYRSVEDAEETYISSVTAAKSIYAKDVSMATNELLQGLRSLESRAMKAEDLTQAVAIKKKIDEVETDRVADNPAPSINTRRLSEARLFDSKWKRLDGPDEAYTLNKNGTVTRNNGCSGEWAAITRTAVLIHMNSSGGEFADIWKFNNDLTSFDDIHAQLGGPWSGQRLSN